MGVNQIPGVGRPRYREWKTFVVTQTSEDSPTLDSGVWPSTSVLLRQALRDVHRS